MQEGAEWGGAGRGTLPFLQLPKRGGLDAVGAPGGVAHVVADGDGEAAEVRAHQVDLRPFLTLNVQARAFTAVLRPTVGTCRENWVSNIGWAFSDE